jgi:hypothetical protein
MFAFFKDKYFTWAWVSAQNQKTDFTLVSKY